MGCIRRWVVERLVRSVDGWNEDFHNAIEQRVFDEYHKHSPPNPESAEERAARDKDIEKMRAFYYGRMVNTASLMVAMASLVVALAALVVALVSLVQ